jgi:Uncharacterized conserved protein
MTRPLPSLPAVLDRKLLEDGSLPFIEFMRIALYDPLRGYYTGPSNPVGPSGDYITAGAMSPVFSFALSRLAGEFVDRSGDALCGIVDIGCGDGRLIRGIMDSMPADRRARCRFFGIDQSLSRVQGIPGIELATSIDEVPEGLALLVFSNELFDAMPFARLAQRSSGLSELTVRRTGDELDWGERPAPAEYEEYFAARGITLEEGQFADISLAWSYEYARIARKVSRGLIVTIDYGFPQAKLFDVRIRRYGTAGAFHQQLVSRDLLARPGEQDLTAHINFSDLQCAGEDEAFSTLLFTRQALFLLSLGITEHELFRPSHELEVESLESAVSKVDERQAARRLVLPDGIGEEMRVLVQARGLDPAPWCFNKRLF